MIALPAFACAGTAKLEVPCKAACWLDADVHAANRGDLANLGRAERLLGCMKTLLTPMPFYVTLGLRIRAL